MQSGSPLSFWAVHAPGIDFPAHLAEVAREVGCKVAGLTNQIDCMKDVNEQVFSDMHWNVRTADIFAEVLLIIFILVINLIYA